MPNSENAWMQRLGWTDFFDRQIGEVVDDQVVGRVCQVQKTRLKVIIGSEELTAELAGRFFHTESERALPALGDWVIGKLVLGENRLVINQVLDRKSCFSRTATDGHSRSHHAGRDEQVIAANLDYVFVVCGLDGELNVRRIERYLAAVHGSGAVPVLVLNKADLCTDIEDALRQVRAVSVGTDICLVSSVTGEGLGELQRFLSPGTTVALIGSSGVGKSSLINRLLGDGSLKTGDVRESDGKGRHTTTWRELVQLENGAVLIDNPGLREFMPWESAVDDVFADILELAVDCRYSTCTHKSEPGCAVVEAVKSGALSAERFRNYRKLQQESKEIHEWMTERDVAKAQGKRRRDGRKIAVRMKGK